MVELPFREVWAVDFEFQAEPGHRPAPVCLVARELRTNTLLRVWQDELLEMTQPPFAIDDGSLIVTYYGSAEMGCFLTLGWPMPQRNLDLFVEFRAFTNGLSLPCGAGLLGALTYFGLDAIDANEKEDMRNLVLRGGPWTDAERVAVLDYCQSDVDSLMRLLPRMNAHLDLPRALLRGRYMCAAAAMEHNVVPIDTATLALLRSRWDDIQEALIARIDAGYGVYAGKSFKSDRFAAWLAANGIPWMMTNGKLDLSDDAFKDMARSYPILAPLRELRAALSQMRLADLAVGPDGRNRTLLSAFRARTSRNQPSNARFIFGPSVWLRGLIQPPPGHAAIYIDWSQQEFGIAAALSGDRMMMDAYSSGDPYLAFAKQAGAAPPDATKKSHAAIRDQFKATVLAVQYGMGEESLAVRIGQPAIAARELLRLHRYTYRRFWEWSDTVVSAAVLLGSIRTVFGWPIHVSEQVNARSLQNFLMQANGAEMLRLACCLGVERGIEVCAPIHDAVLICAPAARIEEDVAAMQEAMAEASRVVLNGFELRSDVMTVVHPERYSDPRGEAMWATVMDLLHGTDTPSE